MQLLLLFLLLAAEGGKLPEEISPLLEMAGSGGLEALAAAFKDVGGQGITEEETQRRAEELAFAAVASFIPEDILRAMREYLAV